MKQKDFKELLEKAGMKFKADLRIDKQADALVKGGEAHLEKVRELTYKHELGRLFTKHTEEHGIVDFRKYKELPITQDGQLVNRVYEDTLFIFTKEQALEILKSLPE